MKRGDLSNRVAWGKGVLSYYTDKYYTQQQIAESLGCSQANVCYWLRKFGLKSYGVRHMENKCDPWPSPIRVGAGAWGKEL